MPPTNASSRQTAGEPRPLAVDDDIAIAREQAEETSTEEGALHVAVQFEDGFTGKTVLGALFVGFIMLPGALYLGLVAGQGLGPAAEWVTIVLFAEVMRRSFLPMRRQEIFVLYYVAAMLSSVLLADRGISGGPFGYLIWNQYFRQSPQAAMIAQNIPNWVAPAAGSPSLTHRTFFDVAWTAPIVLLVINEVLGRLSWLSAGYVLFRVTSDVERLPFPMAPVVASGATALAEASTKEDSWRWRIFSIGSVLGLGFGLIYVAIPIFTGVVFNSAFQLIPIPFIDLTKNTESFLPAAVSGISGDLGKLMIGFILPYPVAAGMLFGAVVSRIFPLPMLLYHFGAFGDAGNGGWTPGMDAFFTRQVTDLKFWMSVGIGLQLAVGLIGIGYVVQSFRGSRRAAMGRGLWTPPPPGRGDVAIWKPLAIWFTISCFYIVFAQYLLGRQGHFGLFPWWILIFFGLVWTPVNSFVSARMVGMTGLGVTFPWLRETAIMKSGYQFVDVWYAPIQVNDYGPQAQRFREAELTGTKFTSIVKIELLILPIFLVSSFVFWAFFWHSSSIPSSQHPFAYRFWPFYATFQAMFQSSGTGEGPGWMQEAIDFHKIGWGCAAGLGMYGVMALLRLPSLFFYGTINGVTGGAGYWPPDLITVFLGAWIGRRYFARRFGVDKWRMYSPVLLAGFACGTGLIAMAAIALALIAKSVNYLPF